MQFQILSTLALAMLAVASPVPEPAVDAAATYALCPNGQQAYCCTFSLGGILNTNCQLPAPKVKSLQQFEKHCSAKGYSTQCCTTQLDGISFLCNPV